MPDHSLDDAGRPGGERSPAAALIRRKRWLWSAVRRFSPLLLRCFYQPRVAGTDHLPRRSAFVLLPKHQCWQDIPMIGWATPRPLYYLAKHELFAGAPGRWLVESLGGIPINRQRPLQTRQSLVAAVNLLKNGEGLVVFPEGTYFKDGMGPGRPGMIKYLFAHTRVPHVPVGIRYHRRPVAPTRVDLTFGRALDPADFRSALDLMARVMEDIAQLSGLAGRHPG